MTTARPAAQFLGLAGLVAAGSAVGTLVRASLELAFPAGPGQFPWTTFLINIVGSCVLAALIETLAFAGPDTGGRRMLRLALGTGVIGGFTTYSTFVLEIDNLVGDGRGVLAVAYALLSVVLGLVAAMIGAGVAASVARARAGGEEAP
ncbi:CrcB family protein [Microbacterium sp. BWT-B31]|uniref:FluC/FEX family fluoride channel n=1 Tax=Microbacterium sp. BWT-B31 TaxID=3232072 RepID=UPI003528CA97